MTNKKSKVELSTNAGPSPFRGHRDVEMMNKESKTELSTNAGNSPPLGGDGGGYNQMFQGAKKYLFELAKTMRKNMTPAEELLWMHLRQGVGGLKFRRQHPLKNYIVDFYCHKIKLVIEADGEIHQREEIKAYDKNREQDLIAWGYSIMRFRNEEILEHEEMVLRRIAEIVETLKQNLRTSI